MAGFGSYNVGRAATSHSLASAVEHLLEILPAWFALPEANAKYVESAERLPGLIARSGDRTIGVLLYRRHFQAAAEIHLMAVDPQWHRRGVGAGNSSSRRRWRSRRTIVACFR
jgi:GNAT superfamily N-acetyltransferase